MGMQAMKEGHWEEDMKETKCADLRYAKHGDDNEKELEEDVNDLASYVEKNRMKY